MVNYKFYLNFQSDSTGLLEIDEPIGFAELNWTLSTGDNLYARDVSFNDGESELTFVDRRLHYLDTILYYLQYFGFDSKVNLIIEIDTIQTDLGELDLVKATTDSLTYIKCKIIQDNALQVIKRRSSVKVDVFSDRDLDGNVIEPLVPENMLILAKPLFKTTEFKQSNTKYHDSLLYASNFAQALVRSEVPTTYSFYENYPYTNGYFYSINNYKIITAANTLTQVELEFDVDYTFYYNTNNDRPTGVSYLSLSVIVWEGETFGTGTPNTVYNNDFGSQLSGTVNQTKTVTKKEKITIPTIERGYNLSVFWSFNNYNLTTGDVNHRPYAEFRNTSFIVKAFETSYNSITPSFRLIDVMRQVIKSISGLDINAPKFDFAGSFYNNRLINGNLLRNITDKGFLVSLDDIKKSIVEMNADCEINDTVFFGVYEDFYKPTEIWFFDNTQFSSMVKKFSDKYAINQFNYKYNKYQSQNENDVDNSADAIHGETSWVFPSLMVENKKEVTVDWIRDPFLIEVARAKNFLISKDTATQNDDDLFCLDTEAVTSVIPFTETSKLSHTYNTAGNTLTLRNDGSVNFVLLGIFTGTNFVIYPPDNNGGIYTVNSVNQSELNLSKLDVGAIGSGNDGIRPTKYTYYLSPSDVPYTVYTDTDFTTISNLNGSDKFANLRYSAKRNINRSYLNYLATANIYTNTKAIKNTQYKNNGDCTTVYNGDTVKENEAINTYSIEPILSPNVYENMIFANVSFQDYIDIQTKVRSERGYISTIDNNGLIVKVYPEEMTYNEMTKELTILKAEEKYQSAFMTINNTSGVININNETTVLEIVYEIVEYNVSIFDTNKRRLYNPVFWNKIEINNAKPETINELVAWLDLL